MRSLIWAISGLNCVSRLVRVSLLFLFSVCVCVFNPFGTKNRPTTIYELDEHITSPLPHDFPIFLVTMYLASILSAHCTQFFLKKYIKKLENHFFVVNACCNSGVSVVSTCSGY